MAVARKFLSLVLAFAAMVIGIEGIRRAADWWHGTLAEPTFADWMLVACLPLVVWLWWHYVSPFGRGRGQCLDGACRAPQERE